MRHEYRYKSVVIPVIKDAYILVKDAKYNELTFVIGGCKLREIPKNGHSKFDNDYTSYTTCALRELKEETRGVFGSMSNDALVPGFKFSSTNRSKSEFAKDKRDGVIVTMRYTVYFLHLDIPKSKFKLIRDFFHQTKTVDGETSDIVLKTKVELKDARMWRFMKEHVLHKLR
jgi:hypothetical protein